jgi:hypothetical protein
LAGAGALNKTVRATAGVRPVCAARIKITVDGTKKDESLRLMANAIAADGNFGGAVTSYLQAFVTWHRSLGNFNRLVSSIPRRRIMKSILRLHFDDVAGNPDNGATFERVLNEVIRERICGHRMLRTTIALAGRSGHLSARRGACDGRLRLLHPTDKWIAKEIERHEVALASLSLLAQYGFFFTGRLCGVALVSRLAVASGHSGDAVGTVLGEPDGLLRSVAALDGGLVTSFAIADAWIRGKRIPSTREIGASFMLSPSQALKIVRLAADHALVTFDNTGKIADASQLAAEGRRLVANELALYAHYVGPVDTGLVEKPPLAAPVLSPLQTH